MPRLARAALVLLSSIPARAALAHARHAQDTFAWSAQPWIVLLLGAALVLYVAGLARLWRHAGAGAGISRSRALAFLGGFGVLTLALCSPIDALAQHLFSVHMVEHELLMVAAAPLLVIGRPLATWTWALAPSGRARVGAWVREPALRTPWRIMTHPLGAFGIHAAALWIWHVPVLFEAALANEAIHASQHASFLFSALLFWWAVLQPGDARMRDGGAIVNLFATMLHTGALGALLTVSQAAWYPGATDPAWSVSAVEDQQIGGLIMWIPAGTVYIAAALWLMARWLAASNTHPALERYANSV